MKPIHLYIATACLCSAIWFQKPRVAVFNGPLNVSTSHSNVNLGLYGGLFLIDQDQYGFELNTKKPDTNKENQFIQGR